MATPRFTTFTFAAGEIVGTTFDFVAFNDPAILLGPQYFIASVSFEEVAPIPLPAGAPLLIGSLAALAMARRSRR